MERKTAVCMIFDGVSTERACTALYTVLSQKNADLYLYITGTLGNISLEKVYEQLGFNGGDNLKKCTVDLKSKIRTLDDMRSAGLDFARKCGFFV